MQAAARYVPLDPWDFDGRTWVPHSGWPITAADLAPHYTQARAFAGLGGEPPANAYQVGLASRFISSLPAALAAHPQVRILTDATVTRLDFVRGRNQLQALRWSSRDGATGEVRAARFVLALGAIENARQLLLAELPND
jgi:choline dehydrogenase-like flavoprotein